VKEYPAFADIGPAAFVIDVIALDHYLLSQVLPHNAESRSLCRSHISAIDPSALNATDYSPRSLDFPRFLTLQHVASTWDAELQH